jgi:hypothetical protein
MRFFLSLLLTLLSLSLAAHELPVEREMMVQRADKTLRIMVVYREPSGKRAERLMAFYDLNQDGRLSSSEATAVAPELTKRAMHEIHVESAKSPLVAQKTDVKVVMERTGGITAAILFEFDVTNLEGFSVRLGGNPTILPLTLHTLPGIDMEPLLGPPSMVLKAGTIAQFDLRVPANRSNTP